MFKAAPLVVAVLPAGFALFIIVNRARAREAEEEAPTEMERLPACDELDKDEAAVALAAFPALPAAATLLTFGVVAAEGIAAEEEVTAAAAAASAADPLAHPSSSSSSSSSSSLSSSPSAIDAGCAASVSGEERGEGRA